MALISRQREWRVFRILSERMLFPPLSGSALASRAGVQLAFGGPRPRDLQNPEKILNWPEFWKYWSAAWRTKVLGVPQADLSVYFVKDSVDLLVLLLYVYTMEYYSATKKHEIMLFAAIWKDLDSVVLSEVSPSEKEKYCMAFFIRGI